MRIVLLVFWVGVLPSLAISASLFPGAQARPSLFDAAAKPLASLSERPSLFDSLPEQSLLDPNASQRSTAQHPAIAALLDLIAEAEAGQAGYDAVQYGARVRPSALPTSLTLGEIYRWIDATPGQPHAIGRYQFIPPTLRRLVQILDLPLTTRFSPNIQDQLAIVLLHDAGLIAFENGGLSYGRFMDNLAKIWAGLPTHTGKSYYHGYAGNKATLTRDMFTARMRRIFPPG